jgi:hypothetical protein
VNSQRLIGIVLLVVGGVALFVGMNSSNSVTDQLSESFTGRFTQATMWYLILGGALALVGLLMVLRGARRNLA